MVVLKCIFDYTFFVSVPVVMAFSTIQQVRISDVLQHYSYPQNFPAINNRIGTTRRPLHDVFPRTSKPPCRISAFRTQLRMMDDYTDPYITSMVVATSLVDENILRQLYDVYMYYLDTNTLFTQACTSAFFACIGDVLAQSVSFQRMRIQQRLDRNDFCYEAGRTVQHDADIAKNTYDIQRTMTFFLKGLGGGCMWSVWFHFSDPISLDMTEQLFRCLPNINSEVTFAVRNGEIDVSTAASITLSAMIPSDFGSILISGRDLQHIIRVFLCIVLEQCFVSPLFFTIWDIPIPALLSGSPMRQIPAQIQAKLLPLLIANAKVWTPANVITYNLQPEHRVLFASMTDVLWQTILSQITSNEISLQPPPPIPTKSLPEQISTSTGVNLATMTDTSTTSSTSNAVMTVSTPNPTVIVSSTMPPIVTASTSVMTPTSSVAVTSTTLFQTNRGNDE
jgi:Mpv17 / PMP22 family